MKPLLPARRTRWTGGPSAMHIAGAIAALLVLQASCTPRAAPPVTPGTSKPVVRIGAVVSLSGSAAPVGASQQNGIRLAQDEVNGARLLGAHGRLDIVWADDASDRAVGADVFRKLIEQDGSLAILGPTLSSTALAADPIAQQAGVPVLGVSNTAGGVTEIGNFIFRDSLTEGQVIPQTVKAVYEKARLKRVALMYGNDDPFTKAGADAFRGALRDRRLELVAAEPFQKGERDFSGALTRVREARPDALFVSALAGEAPPLLQQARAMGLRDLPIVGGNAFNSLALIRAAGDAAEGVVVGAAWNAASTNPKSMDFVKSYRARYNAAPDQFAAQAYAGVYILAESLKTIEPPATRKGLRRALSQVRNLDTVLGPFSFTASGDAQHAAVVQVVRNGAYALY